MIETNTQTNANYFRNGSGIQTPVDPYKPKNPQNNAKIEQGNNQEALIEVMDINVTYNKGRSNEFRALENVNLNICPREYVIIFGPSGCGKSTLLYAISGLLKATSGEIKVNNDSISSFSKKQIAKFHQKKIGMIFQSFHLIPSLNVLDNVILPKIFEGENFEERDQMARVLLDRFGIAEQADKFPSELSGGQKQRVSIARSLINDPEIILADEPVGNLDSKSSYNVMSILKDLNEIDKKTIILVTHDPAHLRYGDKIVHMKDGKIIKIETVKQKQKDSLLESYILKDGKIRPEFEGQLIKEETIPADLRMLMKAFRSLSVNQIGAMLVPFKAQQLFSHIFFTMTDDQIKVAQKRLQDFLFGSGDFDKFVRELDLTVERGGAGWDRRYAETFAQNVKRIVLQANKVSFIDVEKSASDLAVYINHLFRLNLNETDQHKLAQIVLDRLKNRIGIEEFEKIIDKAKEKGGMGFNRRTSQKISRELEIVLLLRYSA
jgi:putative ABC transport system ATP-binding protein